MRLKRLARPRSIACLNCIKELSMVGLDGFSIEVSEMVTARSKFIRDQMLRRIWSISAFFSRSGLQEGKSNRHARDGVFVNPKQTHLTTEKRPF